MASITIRFEDTDDGVRLLTDRSRIEIAMDAQHPDATPAQRLAAEIIARLTEESASNQAAGGIAIH